MRNVTVAATQMSCIWDREANITKAENLVREAAGKGANIILLQELFEMPYFCHAADPEYFSIARPFEDNPMIEEMKALAKELNVVLPVCFYEDCGIVKFNTIAVIDADGTVLGRYRKTHIPEDVNYYEKYYFAHGDTGFKVWDTKFGKIGIGICWDQWFVETARILALNGAELIFYTTAIGQYAVDDIKDLDKAENHIDHWRNTMLGHAAANMIPVVVSNRTGVEQEPKKKSYMRFQGQSFISDNIGNVVTSMDRDSEGVITATFDLDELARYRDGFGIFRDRRPEMYGDLLKLVR